MEQTESQAAVGAVADFIAQQEAEREKAREEKYKKSEERERIMVFTAAALAGMKSDEYSDPANAAKAAVDTAEATVMLMKLRGHLD
ncbi:MAG: hypothetical protein K0S79_56 [Nitrospira sp.]|jgi:hypothetical protein|nr:hypothetical protein [Nitrospira sp.]